MNWSALASAAAVIIAAIFGYLGIRRQTARVANQAGVAQSTANTALEESRAETKECRRRLEDLEREVEEGRREREVMRAMNARLTHALHVRFPDLISPEDIPAGP